MDMKQKIFSLNNGYHAVDVYDIIDPIYNPRNASLGVYHRSLRNDGSYEADNHDFYQPDRQVFVNGVFRTSTYGEALYYESLPHPAMMAHTNPQSILIIGGGEGVLLREVLKHRTFRQVTMLEKDEAYLNTIARRYLAQWNTCDNMSKSILYSCFDNPRARIIYEVRIFMVRNKRGHKESV